MAYGSRMESVSAEPGPQAGADRVTGLSFATTGDALAVSEQSVI